MFKMSPAVAALIVAGLVSLACSDQSGLRSGGSTAGAGGVATGGRTGDGLAGGARGTLGPGGAGGASIGGAGSGTAGASGRSQDVCSGMPPTCFALCEGGVGCQCFCPASGGAGGSGGGVTSGGAAATGGATSAGGAMGGNTVGSGGNASTAGSIRTGGVTGGGGATGGTIRTGGAISTGGSTGPGGSTGTGDAGACLDSTVTFQVNRAPGNATVWCLGQPGSCSSDWLTISSQSGDLTLSGMCRTPCDTCQFMACPIVCAPAQELTTAGATQTWNGTYYLSGTCGGYGSKSAQSTACLSPQCAPAGRYAAHICGFPNPAPEAGYGCGQSTSSTNTTCVDVPFDYPSSTPIVVSLPPQ